MKVDFTLYLITDRRTVRQGTISDAVEEALKGGVRAVQLREKDLSTDELYQLARELRQMTLQYGAKLLINKRVDIALDVNADGIHIPENSIPLETARKIIGPDRIIGASCHSLASAAAADRSGADFITFGPIFQSLSKAMYGNPVGLELLSEAAASLNIPVFALGGINKSNILRVMEAGAGGIALISAVLAAAQPQAAAADLLNILACSAPRPGKANLNSDRKSS